MIFGGLGLTFLFMLAMAIHVVRTGQEMFWLFIILMFPGLGALVYFAAIVVPGLAGGSAARRMQSAARAQLDPGRTYRQAQAALAEADTVQNRLRLAKAAAQLGRHEEAERMFATAATGIHERDPTLLLGRAIALVELRRYDEALRVLQILGEDEQLGRTAPAALALGRAYEGLGREREAEEAYRWAVERLPGLEAMARLAAFLARTGRAGEARDLVAEMDRHIERAAAQFRREYRGWRDLAARAL